jgi:predicted lipoprotein with Yx(FWY)xxD motif
MQTLFRTLVLGALFAIVVAACSGTGGTASPAATSSPAAPASEAPSSEPPASEAPASEPPASVAVGGETVAIAESDLGQILVDGEGRTLYLFTNDTAGESVCYDDCEANWPPLLAEGDITVGAGLDAALFTTVARTDGTMQVKVGEWPLYYFANDAAAGDTNGQGVGEVWFAVSPAGAAIE